MNEIDPQAQQAREAEAIRPAQPGPAQPGTPQPTPSAPPVSASFDFNRPTIISLLYLSSPVLVITGLVGIVLAYVWKDEAHEAWEESHYRYLIRTFWLGLIGTIVSILLLIVLIGFILMVAVGVLVLVRSVLSLVNAQKKQPMPNPGTWLA